MVVIKELQKRWGVNSPRARLITREDYSGGGGIANVKHDGTLVGNGTEAALLGVNIEEVTEQIQINWR